MNRLLSLSNYLLLAVVVLFCLVIEGGLSLLNSMAG